ncbi:MAG: hypothetical protein EBR34_13775 [Sphingomonadaceae bacterium]|nr:hypothetical protein [Sphingomonadaceae bacterium]
MSNARSYKSKMTLLAVLSFGSATLAGFLGSQLLNLDVPQGGFWPVYLVLLGLCALAIGAMVPWWHKLDDVQKAGQLNAWYWGGLIGGLVVLMWLVAATGRTSDFSRGALALLLGETAGFGIAWLIWRWRSSGPAE